MNPGRSSISLFVALFLAAVGQAFWGQGQAGWTAWPGLLLYAGALFFFLRRGGVPSKAPGAWRTGTEALALAGVLGLAAFFRLYHPLGMPPGIPAEEVTGPWLGYAVPAAQWPVYLTGGLSLTHPDAAHWAAVWFKLFEPSRLSFAFFWAFLSLLAFPLGYLLFRDLAGPRAAWGALFFWAVMQWPVTLGRNGHPCVSSILYVLGAVMSLRLAWSKGWPAYWILAGLFSGWGFYAYPLTRAELPLLAVLFAFEFLSRRGKVVFPWKGTGLLLLAFLVSLSPRFAGMRSQGDWLTGSTGDRAFILNKVLEHSSLSPLWDNLARFLPILTRSGCPHNDWSASLPGHPLLDPLTALLLTLGFALALRRWKEPAYFYGLAGALVMSFPSVLSDEPDHITRMVGMAPFIAYLASLAILEIGERVKTERGREVVLILGSLAGIFVVGANYKTYFVDGPRNEGYWRTTSVDSTRVGQAVAEGGDAYEYYLSPAFDGLAEVLFLGHAQTAHMHPLELPGSLGDLAPPSGRGLLFALQQGRTGVLALLQQVYPKGITERCLDPWGRPYLYLFRVPPGSTPRALDLSRAWKGTYWTSLDPSAKPVLRQTDPVLNFSHRDDFPVKDASQLRVEWRGTLRPSRAGTYGFLLAAADQDQVEMELDGRKVGGVNQAFDLFLTRSAHPVVIRLRRSEGFENFFHFAWKPPGEDHFSIVLPEALK